MRFWHWQNRHRYRHERRLTAIVALVAYVLTAAGVPLPASVGKHSDKPFPCQQHACGCDSAEQCWRSCCCYTPREKLVWARQHNVQPPAELIAEVTALDEHDAHGNSVAPASACCAHRSTATASDESTCAGHKAGDHECDHHESGAAKGETCDSAVATGPSDHCGSSAHCGQHESPDCQVRPDASSRAVIGIMALRCRGLSTMWCSCGAVTPPPAIVRWDFCWDALGWLPLGSLKRDSTCLVPPVRPPCG
ncbi:MAG TPA: hypothetical protein VHV08_16765 [Pirellulales bacterium]|nr:hypothetical protein [Pirellulales bacterium]